MLLNSLYHKKQTNKNKQTKKVIVGEAHCVKKWQAILFSFFFFFFFLKMSTSRHNPQPLAREAKFWA